VSFASYLTAVFTEIHLCNVCSGQEIVRRHGRGQDSVDPATHAAAAALLHVLAATGGQLWDGGGERCYIYLYILLRWSPILRPRW
jgi:hypothetical protein